MVTALAPHPHFLRLFVNILAFRRSTVEIFEIFIALAFAADAIKATMSS